MKKNALALSLTVVTLLFSVALSGAVTPVNTPAIKPLAISSTQLVKEPATYLKKSVEFTGTLAGFSGLGLDYPTVKRDVKDYVTLLVYRADVPSAYEIPLSELKIFVNRKLLKDFKRIGQGDTVKVTGTVISTALGDAWLEATKITVLNSVQKEDVESEDEE
ncbi:MAG: hypothetical protein LW809_03515 [Vampirovibrionales bacterium]|jgi:hypothetical protein|nr:hypothetical protein [Vampirovibrionales bacterium]